MSGSAELNGSSNTSHDYIVERGPGELHAPAVCLRVARFQGQGTRYASRATCLSMELKPMAWASGQNDEVARLYSTLNTAFRASRNGRKASHSLNSKHCSLSAKSNCPTRSR